MDSLHTNAVGEPHRATIAVNSEERVSDFRIYLVSELDRRCGNNPRYSMRAFARTLNIQSSFLSKILRGERRVTRKLIDRLAPKLTLHPETVELFKKAATRKSEGLLQPQAKFKVLPWDVFATISNWYHFAIMELTLVKDFSNDPTWIASQLGLPTQTVVGAIERLRRLNLIEEKSGKLVAGSNFSNATDPKTISKAQQALQKDILQMAISAMDDIAPENREQSSITVACSPELLPEVKTKIKTFRRELGAFIENSDKKPERVYHMTIGFYPVSKGSTPAQESLPC